MGKIKTPKQMERHLKGIANHYRIAILMFLSAHTGATLEEVIDAMDANQKTIAEHTRRLSLAGLVNKKYKGRYVEHSLSPYGRKFVKFLESFRQS